MDDEKGREGRDDAAPSRRPSATLRTIAEAAGLGVTTVSKALKDAPDIGEQTKARVRRIAGDLGYRPNRAGVRLRTGRTNVICLVLSPHEEIIAFGSELIYGISEVLRGSSYHLVVTPHFLEHDPMAPIRYLVETRSADGVIFTRTQPRDPRIAYLQENAFPFVTHGRSLHPEAHAFYDYDNEAFARLAVESLAAAGARRVALLQPPPDLTFHAHVMKGFLETAARFGLAAEVLPRITLDTPLPEILAEMQGLARRSDRPDGFVLPGDSSAAAVEAAFSAEGLVIGRDYHVVAKRTFPVLGLTMPKVAQIAEDIRLAGRELGSLLVRRIAGEAVEALQIVEQPALVAPGPFGGLPNIGQGASAPASLDLVR